MKKTTIAAIKANLKRRSGKTWSVTAGRGTACGWLTITAPPARCTARWIQRAGTLGNPGDYDLTDTGAAGGYMTPSDCDELAQLLGLTPGPTHYQGVSVPSGYDYYREYVDRSAGVTPTVKGQQYWD